MFKKEKLILEMAQFPQSDWNKRYQSPNFNKTKKRLAIELKMKSLKRVLMRP